MALLTGAGRVGRLQYFFVNLACVVGLLAPALIGTEADPATGEAPPVPAGLVLVVLLVFLGGAWVSITTSIRRLHDCDHAGWFVLLTPVPFAGFLLGLYLLFKAGDPQPNRYGPAPGSPSPDALRAQLAQMEAVTAPYRQTPGGAGADGDSDPSAPAPSAWPDDAAPTAPPPLTFDPMALYRENPGLAPPYEAHR